MNIFLWIISILGLIMSIIMFIPSIMSLGAPKIKSEKTFNQRMNLIVNLFLRLTLFYPIFFILGMIISLFFNVYIELYFTIYLLILLFLFILWRVFENRIISKSSS